MNYNDHEWVQQGVSLGIDMDRDALARRLMRLAPEQRATWLHQFSQYVDADESPLRKKAQLETLKRHLFRVNAELKAIGR